MRQRQMGSWAVHAADGLLLPRTVARSGRVWSCGACVRMGNAFTMPTRTGVARAAMPADAKVSFLQPFRFSPIWFPMICPTLFLRSGPVTPERQVNDDSDVELADLEQAAGIDGRVTAEPEHFFIAGALLFLDEANFN